MMSAERSLTGGAETRLGRARLTSPSNVSPKLARFTTFGGCTKPTLTRMYPRADVLARVETMGAVMGCVRARAR
jgi:hypothetical protein